MAIAKKMQAVVQRLFSHVEGQADVTTYVILDAARDEKIYKKIHEAGHKSGCLYSGMRAQALAEVAPYLISLKREDPFTEWVLNSGWGNSWGIFLESPADTEQLKRHFQSFIIVSTEDGKSVYFRFYDPRILRVYLPTCRRRELQTFFGPVKSYWLEDTDGALMEFRCTQEFKLIRNVTKLPD
ncbi:MAG: DUF4123 domain-containing protein [Syntrophaceae bacterium]